MQNCHGKPSLLIFFHVTLRKSQDCVLCTADWTSHSSPGQINCETVSQFTSSHLSWDRSGPGAIGFRSPNVADKPHLAVFPQSQGIAILCTSSHAWFHSVTSEFNLVHKQSLLGSITQPVSGDQVLMLPLCDGQPPWALGSLQVCSSINTEWQWIAPTPQPPHENHWRLHALPQSKVKDNKHPQVQHDHISWTHHQAVHPSNEQWIRSERRPSLKTMW